MIIHHQHLDVSCVCIGASCLFRFALLALQLPFDQGYMGRASTLPLAFPVAQGRDQDEEATHGGQGDEHLKQQQVTYREDTGRHMENHGAEP